jgi:hypothetical protein
MRGSLRSWASLGGILVLAALLLWAPTLLKRLGTAEPPAPAPELVSLEIDPPRVEMKPGEIRFLQALATPPGGTEVGWRSSDTAVASVFHGRVRGLKPGRARIEAFAAGAPEIRGYCEVIVEPVIGTFPGRDAKNEKPR